MATTARELPAVRTELRQAILLSGHAAWQVAFLAKLSESMLSRIVTGRRTPTANEAQRLARALGTDSSDLFPGEALS
jgi:transcriptional regulator with XRE-family HTH domain